MTNKQMHICKYIIIIIIIINLSGLIYTFCLTMW